MVRGHGSRRRSDDQQAEAVLAAGLARPARSLAAGGICHARPYSIIHFGGPDAIGETRIGATGGIDLKQNPVTCVLSGPLGTAGYGWPSFFRGTRGMTPAGHTVDEVQPTIEENGFLILDLTPESMTLRFFKWRHDPVASIDSLEPFRMTQLKRS